MSLAMRQAAIAKAIVDPRMVAPAGLLAPKGGADAGRFAIYRNNVFVGLTTALAKRFPVTRRLVGETFFTGMARVYADREKPASPLLFEYGDGFADFIAGFAPAETVPYLADVARIEAAWTRAYHAADAAALTVETLPATDPERLMAARLTQHPAATLLCSSHPAASIWSAHQGDAVGLAIDRQAETALVTRPDFDVAVHVLPTRDMVFARVLFAGEPLGAAAEAAIDADAEFDFGVALVGLIGLGAFGAMQMGEQS